MEKQTLAEFTDANPMPEKMLWKRSAESQINVLGIVYEIGLHYDKEAALSVVSTHTSKSIKLPVALLEVPAARLEVIMRENFFNWAISVTSKNPLNADFPPPLLLEPDGCFEGYEGRDLPIYDAWEPDARRFSGNIWNGGGLMIILTRLLDSLAEIRAR